MLKFKSYSSQSECELIEIADGAGNILCLPKRGFLNWKENKAFTDYTAKASRNANLSMADYKLEVVTILLKIRLGLAEDVTADELLVTPDGSPLSQPMVDELFDFFMKEQLKWDEGAIQKFNQQMTASLTQPLQPAQEVRAELLPLVIESKSERPPEKSKKRGFESGS